MPISAALYNKVNKINHFNFIQGGQELILFEIIGACHKFKNIYLPFYSSGTLFNYLLKNKFTPICDYRESPFNFDPIPKCEVIYFGTPTIVNNKPFFLDDVKRPETWNKNTEQKFVRWLCSQAKKRGYKKIISGLGSGDISCQERIEDMGGGQVICYKKFEDFEDWVIEYFL